MWSTGSTSCKYCLKVQSGTSIVLIDTDFMFSNTGVSGVFNFILTLHLSAFDLC
jgi:hypothetical protein